MITHEATDSWQAGMPKKREIHERNKQKSPGNERNAPSNGHNSGQGSRNPSFPNHSMLKMSTS